MFNAIVILLEGAPRVVGRVNEDALHLPREFLFQRLQGEKVVTEDQAVVEDVGLRYTPACVVREGRILEKDARLELSAVLLPDPGEFEARARQAEEAVGSINSVPATCRLSKGWSYFESPNSDIVALVFSRDD